MVDYLHIEMMLLKFQPSRFQYLRVETITQELRFFQYLVSATTKIGTDILNENGINLKRNRNNFLPVLQENPNMIHL